MPSEPAAQLLHAPGGQTPFQALWRTREYLRPYRWQLVLMLAAAFGAVASEIVIPLLTKAVIDGPIAHAERRLLLPLGLAAIGLGTAQAALNLIRRWVQASAVTGMELAMRDDIYAHLQRLHTGFHDSWQSGQLLSRATTDLSAIRRFAGFGTIFFITNVVTFVTVIGLLIDLNWWLGLVTGCVFLPVAVACFRFERRYRVLSRRAVYRTQLDMARLRGTFWAGLDLIPNVMIGLILLLGTLAASRHELSLGGLVAFITLTLQLVWPIEAMGYILASGQEAATAAQRIYEILDTEPAITDPADGVEAETGAAPETVPRQRSAIRRDAAGGPGGPGRLVFDHVEFRYPGAPRPVLRDIRLELEPGETLALVGATGSGKTTLLQLIPRLADVTAGSVRLDGTDIRELTLPLLRARVGCAFEDPTLFSASVRENVSFGATDASQAAIEDALAAAQAAFVYDLPWGLDTRIGEQGMALSGGQRQRVALARAILARPSVLVLDDPLSALDVHTEAKVTEALRRVLSASTALVVAHRPSTVLLADRVALLDGGMISALGTHRELLAGHPRYRDLMSAVALPGEPGTDDGGAADAGDKCTGGTDPGDAAGQGLTGAHR